MDFHNSFVTNDLWITEPNIFDTNFDISCLTLYRSDNGQDKILNHPRILVVTKLADKRVESLIFDLTDYPTNPG